MIIYEVEIFVKDKNREEKFKEFMLKKHLSDLMQTGCFLTASLSKRDDFGKYRASYHLKNKENLDLYLNEYAPKLRLEFIDMFPNGEIEISRNIFDCLYFRIDS